MKRRDYLAMIAHDMGAIFELVGFASLVPFVVLIYYQEWDMVIPMASVPIAFMALGLLISQIPTGEYTPHLSIALVTVALTWFFIAVIGAIPFVLGLQMSFTDSMFEAMSGWTTTGFTMMTSLDTAPRTLIFWRSLMQWLGGIGVIAFTIAMQTVTGLGYSQLFRSEGRTEAFTPSVVSTGRRIWGIYAALTVIFTILIMLSGLSFWDALNLVMSTLSTGGFSIHDAGVRYYQNVTLEAFLIPVMIAGALPFKLYFLLYQKRDLKILRDATVVLFLLLIFVGAVVVTLDLRLFNAMPLSTALREGAFITVSGITCTGLQNSDMYLWAAPPIILIVMLMFIGGASGSTAGGIKVNRLVLAYEGLVWWFKRFFVRGNVIVPFRHEGRVIPRDISELELSKNMLIVALWLVTLSVAVTLALHLYATAFTPYEVLFEYVSAMSNVGLGVGYMTPASPLLSKWMFILLMWIGRLEVIPVIVLAIGLFRGFEARVAK